MTSMQTMLLILSLSGAPPAARLDELFAAGEPSSPVRVVLYVSVGRGGGRELASGLHREVEAGRLKGKVRLALRPLPAQADDDVPRALIAAARQGMLWTYLVSLRADLWPLHESTLQRAADRSGLDSDGFHLAFRDRDTDLLLDALRRDCAGDRVTAEPSAFVDGRRLRCGPTCEELVAALLAEHARVANERAQR